jgi:hypothetical protein
MGRGGDLISFQDIQPLPVLNGEVDPNEHVYALHILPVTQGNRLYVWVRGGRSQ